MTPIEKEVLGDLQVAKEEGFDLLFKSLGDYFHIPAPILLAMASKETNMGRGSAVGKWVSPFTGKVRGGSGKIKPLQGDRGYGHGLLQVDIRTYKDIINVLGVPGSTGAILAYPFVGAWIFRYYLNLCYDRGYRGMQLLQKALLRYNGRSDYPPPVIQRWKIIASLYNDARIPDERYMPAGLPNTKGGLDLQKYMFPTVAQMAKDFNDAMVPGIIAYVQNRGGGDGSNLVSGPRQVGATPKPASAIANFLPNMYSFGLRDATTEDEAKRNMEPSFTLSLPPSYPTEYPPDVSLPTPPARAGGIVDTVLNTIGTYMRGKEVQTQDATAPSPLLYVGGTIAAISLAYMILKPNA